MEETLRTEIGRYEERERHLREVCSLSQTTVYRLIPCQRNEEQARKICALQNAIRALTINEDDTNDENVIEYDELREDDGDDLPEPFFDELEGVFRCVECHWEVIDGECQFSGCGLEHAIVEVNNGSSYEKVKHPI